LEETLKTQKGQLLKYLLSFSISLVPFVIPFLSFAGGAPNLDLISSQKSSLPGFVYEVGDNVFAQSSEVTIHLEKKIRYPKDTLSGQDGFVLDADPDPRSWRLDLNDFHVPEGEYDYSEPASSPSALSFEGDVSAEGTSEGSSDDVFADFDDLDDPFASDEEEVALADDPYEGYNRFMYSVNETIYDYFMEPLARGFRFIIPEEGRIVIRNIFDNALAPVKLVSSLVQGDLDKSGRVVGRFLINSTVGLGGMLDVAGQEYHIENVNEDFDQALGYHDMPTGPYIVLPFYGPSTGRGVAGLAVDTVLNPLFFLDPGFVISSSLTVTDKTNQISFIIDDIEALDEGAIDEYESVRDFYLQYREGLLKK
jgi:phospholipid-binding lipoprotein MlaA